MTMIAPRFQVPAAQGVVEEVRRGGDCHAMKRALEVPPEDAEKHRRNRLERDRTRERVRIGALCAEAHSGLRGVTGSAHRHMVGLCLKWPSAL